MLEIVCGQVVADRERKKVDDLVHMRPDQARAENALAASFDQGLVSVDRLGDATRRVLVSNLLTIDPEFQPCRARLRFAQTHGGDRRQREGDARHAPIVRPVAIAFQKVGRDHFGVVARYRRQRRPLGGSITGRVDSRIGDALQKFVQDETALLRRQPRLPTG